jgi:hypothetical membrane protein
MTTMKIGPILWVFCLQYFVGEAIAILGSRRAYSLRTNFISDLGALVAARTSALRGTHW